MKNNPHHHSLFPTYKWYLFFLWNHIQSTLADEFLADLDELEALENEEEMEQKSVESTSMPVESGENDEEGDSEYDDSENDEDVGISLSLVIVS